MKIGFIGAGNMASALISGLLDTGYQDIMVSDPKPSAGAALQALQPKMEVTQDNQAIFKRCDVVVIAVKPQHVLSVLSEVKGSYQGKHLISVAAGISTSKMQPLIERGSILVRAMPNTPALVKAGMTALFSDCKDSLVRSRSEQIFAAVGETLWLDDEAQMHAVTATSGSGPAYFFLLMEAMIEASTALGLTTEQAQRLVKQTALGACQLAMLKPEQVSQLRQQVTSPGGTTEAALQVFADKGFPAIVTNALSAAQQRSIALDEMA